MNKRERLIYVTEQRLRGFDIVFDDRWDHHLALEALGECRGEFDRWATRTLETLESGYRPLPHLVVWFLWDGSSAFGPSRRKDGTLGWAGPLQAPLFETRTRLNPVLQERHDHAIQLHAALEEGRKQRREYAQGRITFGALQPPETTLRRDMSLALA